MTTHKAFVAVVASELPITEMGLDMRLDVLFPAEFLAAIFVPADPFVVDRIRALDELGNVV